MNTNLHISNQAELEQLISRYFDGETSIKEEQELRQCLADSPWSSELIDDARFTMGYFAAHVQEQQSSRKAIRSSFFRITSIAASIAVLLAIGGGILWHSQQPKDVCIAYVNGKTIQNEKEVLKLMASDLNDIDNASQSLTEQLSNLGKDIEIDI